MNAHQVFDFASLLLRGDDPVGRGRLTALRRVIGALEPGSMSRDGGAVPVGPAAIDGVLGGGLALGSLHEIAAPCEAEVAAATAFALALAARPERTVVWAAEDFGLAENGVPYGPGLDDLGLAPERLVTVAAAKARDVLWAMEEALCCGGVGAVIGEIRGPRGIDLTASRRLSLAAGRRHNLALLLRTEPGAEASAAVTRWVAGHAPSVTRARTTGPPRLALTLARNRRGQLGSWTVEWNRVERCFDLAPAHRELVAETAFDRSRRAAS